MCPTSRRVSITWVHIVFGLFSRWLDAVLPRGSILVEMHFRTCIALRKYHWAFDSDEKGFAQMSSDSHKKRKGSAEGPVGFFCECNLRGTSAQERMLRTAHASHTGKKTTSSVAGMCSAERVLLSGCASHASQTGIRVGLGLI